MQPVSIIIVNWNTSALLKKALLSVEKEKGEVPVEIIVVDNGSADESAGMVKKEFPDAVLIENNSNRGFAKAVNQGIRRAKGEAIMLLNSDAELLPGTLKKLYGTLFSDSRTGIVGAELIHEDGSLQNSIDHFPNLFTELLNKSLLKRLFPGWYPGKKTGFTRPAEVPSVIGAAVMVKREMVEEVGMLDEDYFFFQEETDWCLRMKQKGWKRIFVPGARVRHQQGQTAKRHNLRSKIEFYKSRYLFFKKHRSALSLFILRLGLFLRILAGMITAGLGLLLTAGHAGPVKDRFNRYCRLLNWHIRGCPGSMGLPVPEKKPQKALK